MKRLIHISDIHFGRVQRETVRPLIQLAHDLDPDVVIVSGDLTQRAHATQFRLAKSFLHALPKPQIVVPGNHDVPFWNVFGRFLHPLNNYRRIISDDLFPYYRDDEIAIVGVNTARSLTVQYGRINREQVEEIRHRLCGLPRDMIKIVVTHHPFDVPADYRNKNQILRRARRAMKSLAQCGADLFLAGHLHISYTGSTTERYKIDNYSALIVQAGTAISNRQRKEPNSFNVIECDYPKLTVITYEWDYDACLWKRTSEQPFTHTSKGWVGAEDPQASRVLTPKERRPFAR